jgi:hypothetical protein
MIENYRNVLIFMCSRELDTVNGKRHGRRTSLFTAAGVARATPISH